MIEYPRPRTHTWKALTISIHSVNYGASMELILDKIVICLLGCGTVGYDGEYIYLNKVAVCELLYYKTIGIRFISTIILSELRKIILIILGAYKTSERIIRLTTKKKGPRRSVFFTF